MSGRKKGGHHKGGTRAIAVQITAGLGMCADFLGIIPFVIDLEAFALVVVLQVLIEQPAGQIDIIANGIQVDRRQVGVFMKVSPIGRQGK